MIDLKVLLVTLLGALALIGGPRIAAAQPSPAPAPTPAPAPAPPAPPEPPREPRAPLPPVPPRAPRAMIVGDGNFRWQVDSLRDRAMSMAFNTLDGNDVDQETLDRYATEIGLTAEQRRAVRDTADEARKQSVRASAEMEIDEIDLQRELDSDQPDEAKVGAAIDKLAMVEGSARKANVLAEVRMRKILSADQRTKLEWLQKKRHDDFAKHGYHYEFNTNGDDIVEDGVAPKAKKPSKSK